MSERERHTIAHDSHRVELVRCTEDECNALSDWCDSVLGRDYFFKRRHLLSILQRNTNQVFAVLVNDHFAGLSIVYKNCVLDNLYISPEYREFGVGSAVLQFLRPRRIRSKTNMLAGDPTGFYEKNGYVKDVADPERPHIIDMVLPQGSTGTTAAAKRPAGVPESGKTNNNGDQAAERVGSGPPPVVPHEPARNGIVPLPPLVPPVAPHGEAVLLGNGQVIMSAELYSELKTMRQTRDRVRNYRARRKAEQQAVDAAAAAPAVTVGPPSDMGNWLLDLVGSRGE